MSSASSSQIFEVDNESGYVSGSGSDVSVPEVFFTKAHLRFLNRQLQSLEPRGRSSPHSYNSKSVLTNECRNLAMVHHVATQFISDNRLWTYGSCHIGHALEDENTPPTISRSDIS